MILPTYNEAENLETIVAAVLAAVPGVHVLVVDDSSPDGTGAIADRIAAELDGVEVLHRPRKSGLGPRLRGRLRARAARGRRPRRRDGRRPLARPRRPAAAARALAEGADLVLGSRYVPGGGIRDWDALRRGISRFGCGYARRVLGVPVRDLTGGFKAFRARALEAIDYASVRSQGYAFQVELTYRALRRGLGSWRRSRSSSASASAAARRCRR